MTEIAQLELSDLAFKVHTLHCTCSSTIAKTLWDIGKANLTSVSICPHSSPMSIQPPKFQNIATEYPEADYPGHQGPIEHRQFLRARFNQLAGEAGARQPEELVNAKFLLMDGAYMAARLFGCWPHSPAANMAKVAKQLMDGQNGEESVSPLPKGCNRY